MREIQNNLQDALEVIEKCCREVQLSVNAQKSEAVIFTLKRKLDCSPLLQFNGVRISFQNTVRYLGVILDSKLPHSESKSRRLSVLLAQCRRAISPQWGISPKLMLWLYTAVIRPALIYGSAAWVTAIETKANVALLEKVQ